MGMKDNFWQMGDTGPCGPCSEIHYDMGVAASDAGHTDCQFPCECGRYVEIWNLVFMQFDKTADGKFNPLPKPSIDTGAGLERVTAVLQGVISNYDTDLFVPLIQRAAELTGTKQLDEELKREDWEEQHHQAASLRVIADHARAATFLISDGVLPMNEGRGYVLRKIIRRAIRHGRLLGAEKPFLYEMVFAVRDMMKDAYPELIESANRVSETIKGEETRFAHTLGCRTGSFGRTDRPCRKGLDISEYHRRGVASEHFRALGIEVSAGSYSLTFECATDAFQAKKHSSFMTPLDCLSTSWTMQPAIAGSRSIRPGSTPPWKSSASARGFLEGRWQSHSEPRLSGAAADEI